MSPPLIPPNGFGGPPRQDDLVGHPGTGPAIADDLVNRSPADPILAALAAYGVPTGPQTPIPAAPGLQPMAGGDGPVTDPSQLPPPREYQPTAPQAGAPEVPVTKPPGGPLSSGDVGGATKEQNSAVTDETKNIVAAELAKTDALAAHANARANIYDGHATAQGLMDEQYQKARAAARQDANAETAAWMRDLDKKVSEEPVPGRWWANMSTFGKVMSLMSLAFGAMAQAKNPNLKNIALEMITKETEADMVEQRDRIKRQIDGMKVKGELIDKRLQAQIADARDDHTLLSSRLAIVQQAALERANAPGSADQKAAMAEAAQWAGQQRLTIAGERANKAYSERDAQLGRDAENARAMLTDRRDRDIAAATIQKDYDLARITAKSSDKIAGAEKFKDIRVLHPDITGIRVVDTKTGAPIQLPIGPAGGFAVSTKHEGLEKEVTQSAELAQDRFALLNRVSSALGKDEDLRVLLKRNPQLVSDLQKLGYQQARENDPRGIVTDKDLISGMESALGGDLSSLSGRVASGTFSAGQGKLKEVVDKAIRDMPAKVSNRFGSILDASIPGYEGNVRVDWTPKSVEIDEPNAPTSRQIDATYGIKSAVRPPQSMKDLEQAQKLETGGVEALPPYRPGSKDKVLKALEDFKNAPPDTIEKRGGVIINQLNEAGDKRAAWEVAQGMEKQRERATDKVRELGDAFVHESEVGHEGWYVSTGKIDLTTATKLATKYGLSQMTGPEILDLIKAVGLKPKD